MKASKLTREIFCCGCNSLVQARLTDGKEIYPHRADLYSLPMWICDACKNYVGCHHKTSNPTNPLGIIPTKQIMNARKHIHKILDPLWKKGGKPRGKIYSIIAGKMSMKDYHTANIKTLDEAREVYRIIRDEFYPQGIPEDMI